MRSNPRGFRFKKDVGGGGILKFKAMGGGSYVASYRHFTVTLRPRMELGNRVYLSSVSHDSEGLLYPVWIFDSVSEAERTISSADLNLALSRHRWR